MRDVLCLTDHFVECKDPLRRIDAVPRHRIIRENSPCHFQNCLLIDGGSWLVCPVAFVGVARARENYRLATLRRPKTVAGRPLAVAQIFYFKLNITLIQQ